jgi:hypothetical protein
VEYALRFTGEQHAQLKAHLFPGDGKEAAALVLCGRLAGPHRHIFSARQIVLIPLDKCKRERDGMEWPTRFADELLREAMNKRMAIVPVHSHPGGFEGFSARDDRSDLSFFESVNSLLEDGGPHASAVMLPGQGRIFARAVTADGNFAPVGLVSVVGDDLEFWHAEGSGYGLPEFVRRHAQAFGAGTMHQLRRLRIAVIGCSGTGSPLIEQLVRLGVGQLLLVDPDRVEWKNLNRIYLTTAADANLGRFKVEVLAEAIGRIGLATQVVPLAKDLATPSVVREVASCDVVIGCMDTAYGRDLLNRLAAFYVLPYVDMGTQIHALAGGGVDQITGAIHYLQPGKSSLKSRGVYTGDDVRAELLRRDDPIEFRRRLAEGYIKNVQEDQPAVISVNSQVASMAVNELLARIHRYRNDPNGVFALQQYALHEGYNYKTAESKFAPCAVLGKEVGRGDVTPLLDWSELTETEDRP